MGRSAAARMRHFAAASLRLVAGGTVALAALALLPAAAQASLLKVTAGTLFYVDTDPDAVNSVTVKLSSDQKSIVVTDSGRTGGKAITVTSDGSCTGNRGTGSCAAAGVSVVDVETGDQADTVHVTVALPARLVGGAGDDRLTGGPGPDLLEGDTGADVLAGGDGRDTVDYSNRTGPVTVTLDGNPGSGEAGEGDTVMADVESVFGGAGDDTLTGNSLDNTLIGNGGNDTLNGVDGDDHLSGGDGNDAENGGAGNDQLNGGAGDDTLAGGDGDDVTSGDEGNDTLLGGAGNDQVNGGAGDDTLDGGPGADALIGGDGTDTTSYLSASAGVTVTLDGKPGDGPAGDNDNVDTENVVGSPGDDTLIGNRGANALQGSGGNDRIVGGKGADLLDGGPGDDLIQALDGVKDTVPCGDGADGVVSDKRDLRSDCEQIKYRSMQATSTRVHVAGIVVRVPIRCQPGSATGCAGRLALEYRKRVLGTVRFRLSFGRRWIARVHLTRRGRGLVARHRLLTASLIVANRDAAGVVTRTRQTIRIGG